MIDMGKRKIYSIITVLSLVAALFFIFTISAYAAGDVAGAIEKTWTAAQSQIKTVVNNVVFPVLDMILAVLFFVKVGSSYFEYRKHGMFEFTAPAILFACLLFTLTAPLYIWSII
jgi:hypothetical protein